MFNNKKFLEGAFAFALLPFLTGIWQYITVGTHDFGDAPDGKPTYYAAGFAQTGNFPTLRASNGARAKKVSEVWLGNQVDKELDANLVNNDAGDDGISLNIHACAKSAAKFFVHVARPKKISGTAYLNLFVDWNKDGKWGGNDGCADEWAVKNFPVDLAKQANAIAVYAPEFIAGKNVNDIWYRVVVTEDEKMASETGTGVFRAGEVEDYGPEVFVPEDKNKPKKYKAVCDPEPLVVDHGSSAELSVREFPGSELITNVAIDPNVNIKNAARNIKPTVTPISFFAFSYQSNQKDAPDRVESEILPLTVSFGPLVKLALNCQVYVIHKVERIIIEEPPRTLPPPVNPPVKPKFIETKSPANPKSGVPIVPPITKFPSFDSYYKQETTGDTTNFSVYVTPQDLAGRKLTGLAIQFSGRNYVLPVPAKGAVNLNGGGYYKSNWNCSVSGNLWKCFGGAPLLAGKTTILSVDFDKGVTPPAYLTVALIDEVGNQIGTVGVQLR